MKCKVSATSALILSAFLVASCGGGGGGGGAAPSGPYDLDQLIFGDLGVSRAYSLSGADNAGNVWTADLTRVTPTTKPAGSFCLDDETHLDTSSTLTVSSGGISESIIADVDNCWTRGTNNLMFQFSMTVNLSPVVYVDSVTGGGYPAQATIGNGGTASTSNVYEEAIDPATFRVAEDNYVADQTTSWKLEDQGGKAVLVVTTTRRDTGGTLMFTEVDEYTITPEGTVQGIRIRVEYGFSTQLSVSIRGLIINLST